MIKINRQKFKNLLVILGALLLAGAMLCLGIWHFTVQTNKQNAQKITNTIYSLIPTPQAAVPEEQSSVTMPTLSVNGADFVGILEMPSFGSTLPVAANFENTAKYPCKFSGSLYTGDLKIGATSQNGQYSFAKDISVGETLHFTNTLGNRYAYTVSNIKVVKHINETTLNSENAQLTLFVKNVYDTEYFVFFCTAKK